MKRKNIIVSHPTGNANVRAVAESFAKNGILAAFYTCIATYPGNIWYKLSKIKPLAEFGRRSFNPVLRPYTKLYPFKELGRMISLKGKLKSLIKHETGYFSVDSIYRSLDKFVASKLKRGNVSAVYGYEDGALETFREAKKLNMDCLYDLPIGYWRTMRDMLEGERVNRPEWAVTLTGFNDSDEKLKRKDDEIALADAIYVASSFTKKTLEQYPGKLPPVFVVPYGFPPIVGNRTYNNVAGKKLRLLFVGGLSQRKGLANIFEAVEELQKYVELTVIGGKLAEGCVPLDNMLKKHTWIPSLPHDQILEKMKEHDIFVFPSLFEGYGLVITEAMSQGTPVITTERTCAADIIKDGETGWIVEPGSTISLVNKLRDIIANPESIESTGRAAMAFAATMPIDNYGDAMAKLITEFNKS